MLHVILFERNFRQKSLCVSDSAKKTSASGILATTANGSGLGSKSGVGGQKAIKKGQVSKDEHVGDARSEMFVEFNDFFLCRTV